MKKFFAKFKVIFVLFLILPVIVLFSACNSLSTAEKLASELGYSSVEEMWADLKGADGVDGVDGIDGTNGKDGSDADPIDLHSIYLEAVEKHEFSGTYLEFLTQIMSGNNANTTTEIASRCISSVFSLVVGSSTTGSAVLYKYNDDGTAYVVTNYHMISGATASTSCHLYFYFGTDEYTSAAQTEKYQSTMASITARVLGGIKQYDVAVLLVDEENTNTIKEYGMQAVTFKDHSLGETCYAIGNNKGLGLSVSSGIVSKEYEIVITTIGGTSGIKLRVLRHDAYITNGNSGGGLFDSDGNLIGLTNGGVGSDTELRNYAIPSSIVQAVANNVIDNYERGLENAGYIFNLGMSTSTTSTDVYYDAESCLIVVNEVVALSSISSTLNWQLISATCNDTPETQVDLETFNILQTGDVFVSLNINGKEYQITRNYNLLEFMLDARIGDTITITLERDDITYTISLFLTQNLATAT